MQSQIRAGAELSPAQQSLLDAISTDSISSTPDGLDYVPQRIPGLFEPGVTTIDELRQGAGVGEVGRLANYYRRLNDIDISDTTVYYDDSLNGHCDSFFEEDIRAACEAGDGTSCFRVNRIERRDFDIIAEACELAPYMLLCEPEDPPPYDLPRINES